MERIFDFIQIGSLVAFGALFVGWTIYLRAVRGVQAIHLSRGKPLGEALLEGLLMAVLPIFFYEALAVAWPLPWHIFPAPLYRVVVSGSAARVAGCLLIVGSIALFAAALRAFGDSWRVGIDRDTPGKLATGGVFARSRNPIFVFMDAFAVGLFLLNGRLLFGLFAVLTVVAIHFQIRREEIFLEERYGDEYRTYRKRSPRYLGW